MLSFSALFSPFSRFTPRQRSTAAGWLATLVLGCVGSVATAQTLASWEVPVGFPNGTGNVPTGNTYVMPNVSTAGTTAGQQWPALPAEPYPNGTPTVGSLAGNPAAILSTFHALIGATYTSPSGNGSQYSFSSNNWSPGDYYQITLPTTDASNLQLSWDQARSSTGPAAFSLQMSTNGTDFTELTTYTVLQSGGGSAPGTWSSSTYNPLYTSSFLLPESAEDQSALTIRFVNAEAAVSSASGSNRIDNITVTSVPEPAALAAGWLALAALGAHGRLRRRS